MNNSTVSFHHSEHREQVSCTFKVVSSVTISAVALISSIGNILVITSFITTQNLRTSTNYYIASMTVSDFLWVATNWPIYLTSRLGGVGLQTALSTFGCRLANYLTFVSYSVSIKSLVLTTVDRFIAIVFPMRATMITGRIRAIFLFLTWILPMGFLSPYLFFTRTAKTPDELYLCPTDMSTEMSRAYTIVGFVLLYCVPLTVIIILNSRIIKTLGSTDPAIQGHNHTNATRRKQNQRLTKLLTWINALFFISWTPYYVNLFVSESVSHGSKSKIQEILFIFSQFLLPLVSTAANPIILFTLSTNYRQALKNCLRFTCRKYCLCLALGQVAPEDNVELPCRH